MRSQDEKVRERGSAISLGFPSAYVHPLHIIGNLPPPQWRFSPLQQRLPPPLRRFILLLAATLFPPPSRFRFGYHITTITPLVATNPYPPDPLSTTPMGGYLYCSQYPLRNSYMYLNHSFKVPIQNATLFVSIERLHRSRHLMLNRSLALVPWICYRHLLKC